MEAYAQAIESIELYDGDTAFAFTGENCPEALVASVSDFILSLVAVNFSVVYSRKETGLKLSVRCSSGLDAGVITARALAGFGSGGGHQVMAGGFVPFTGQDMQLAKLVTAIKEAFIQQIKLAKVTFLCRERLDIFRERALPFPLRRGCNRRTDAYEWLQ